VNIMALNNNKEIRIDKRRQLVASLLLRVPGITQRQVCDHLAEQGVVNPSTNESYSLGTINNDIQSLRDEWRKHAAEEVAERKARILAELDELRRAAWGCGDLDVLLKIQKREADLLGLDAPQRQEVSGPSGGAIDVHDSRFDAALEKVFGEGEDE